MGVFVIPMALIASPAQAQTAFGATISPGSGPRGSTFTISWYTDWVEGTPCDTVWFATETFQLPSASWREGSVTAVVPDVEDGTYPIGVYCSYGEGEGYSTTLRFTVKTSSQPTSSQPPTSTTPPRPPVTTPPPVVATTAPPVVQQPPRTTPTTPPRRTTPRTTSITPDPTTTTTPATPPPLAS
ncbi:hypothetical protein [Actinokineospora bangkokensis]|nr:hypothetical protein [Actinokineospora bangkokensis]